MAGRVGQLGVQRRAIGAVRLTQVGLLIACLGALLVIFNLFGWAEAGLVLAPVGMVLAARGGFGRAWFWMVAAGAILVVVSRLVADGSETLGGWLAVVASLLILLGSTIGFPSAGDQPDA
jgi:hypothetical protein